MAFNYKSPEQLGLLHSEHPDVLASSAEVYQQVASIYSEDTAITATNVHRQMVCGDASALLLDSLGRRGYHTWQRTSKAIRSVNDDWVEFTEIQSHDYLIGLSRRGIIVFDPTWKQFVDDEEGIFPNILVGTRAEVIEVVQKAGVEDYLIDLWRPHDSDTGIKPPFETI